MDKITFTLVQDNIKLTKAYKLKATKLKSLINEVETCEYSFLSNDRIDGNMDFDLIIIFDNATFYDISEVYEYIEEQL